MWTFRSFSEAVANAPCGEWVTVEEDEIFDRNALLELAKAIDAERVFEGGFLFLTSREGAIGIAYQKEYQVRWKYLPSAHVSQELAGRLRAKWGERA